MDIVKLLIYTKYLPSIIFQIKNWPNFLLHYLGIKKGGSEYVFRNGIKIITEDSVSTATVAVIFVKKDYGSVPENSVVIDIGANIGVYSIFAATSKNTQIFAFEPVQENFNLLKENIKLNFLENKIHSFNFGIAGKEEKKKLYLGESPFHSFIPAKDSPFNALYSSGKGQNYSEVNCISLKDVFDKNKIDSCHILKMDCEGAEYEILYNLPDEYFRKIEKIRMEYHNHKENEKNTGDYLIKFLKSKGFKIEKQKKSSLYQGDLWLKNER